MKRAVVLSGGGAKGAYELGVWKAFRKLGIEYDIVTGTSIGALNAVMMAQNNYAKCLKLWYFMNYDYVSSMEIKGKYSTVKGRREIALKYTKGVLTGGYEMDGLSKVIDYAVDFDALYKSKIDYGLVTTYFPSFKGKYVKKDMLTKDNLKDYLLATSACFPAFKPIKINKSMFVDGGYTDNMPINLAIELGADEIIAVDLGAIGINKKTLTKNIKIDVIKPSHKLGSLLVFEKDYTRRYLKLGYYDTMKYYNKLDGKLYTFKAGSLRRNYNRNYERFYNKLKEYESYINKPLIKKLMNNDSENYFNEIFESLLSSFNIDPINVYRASYLNVVIRNNFLSSDYKKYNSVRKVLKKELKTNNTSIALISFMYNLIKDNKKNLKIYINTFPKAFLCAVYLSAIMR